MHRLSAGRLWLVHEAVDAFTHTLIFTVAAVYFVVDVGMNPLQLVLVGTALELAFFVFEVPTGIVADTYSRRLSVVIGTIVMGVSFVLVGLGSSFVAIAIAYAVMGFGWTFTSGAFDAWLADEVGPDNVGPVYQRGAQVGRIAALAGLPASVGLALVDLRLPIVLGGLGVIALGVFYVLAMDETGHVRPEDEDRGWRALAVTAKDGARLVRSRPLLLLIMGISAIWGLWSEGLDRLSEAHFLTEVGLPKVAGLDPVVWFGIFGAGGLLLSIFVAAPLRRRFEAAKAAELVRILFVLDVVLIAGTIAFGLAGALAVAIAARWLVGIARSLAMPLYSTWLNQSIEDSRVRATVISITNQADAVGQWTGGPGLGAIGTVFSIRAALVVAGLALSPALALYGRAIRRHGREPELAAPQAVM